MRPWGTCSRRAAPSAPWWWRGELTKLHEEVWRGTLVDAAASFGRVEARGEIVVVLAGDPGAGRAPTDAEVEEALAPRLEAGDSLRDAATAVASGLGVSRRRAYDLALGLRRNETPPTVVD